MESHYTTNSGPLSLAKITAKLSLTKAEGELVNQVCAAITERHDRLAQSTPEACGMRLGLAEQAFVSDQCEENREALAKAALEAATAKTSFASIERATHSANKAEIDKLIPVAVRQIEVIEKAANAAAVKYRAALAEAAEQFEDIHECEHFNERLSATLAMLSDDRNRIENGNAALHYLVEWSLSANPFAIPAAPVQPSYTASIEALRTA